MDDVELSPGEQEILNDIIEVLEDASLTEPRVVASQIHALIVVQSPALFNEVAHAIVDVHATALSDSRRIFPVKLCRDLSNKMAKTLLNQMTGQYTTFHKIVCDRLKKRIDVWCAMRSTYDGREMFEDREKALTAILFLNKMYSLKLASKKLMLNSMMKFLASRTAGKMGSPEVMDVDFVCLSVLLIAYSSRNTAGSQKPNQVIPIMFHRKYILQKCHAYFNSYLGVTTISPEVRAKMQQALDLGRAAFPKAFPTTVRDHTPPTIPATVSPVHTPDDNSDFVLLPESDNTQSETVSVRSETDTVTSNDVTGTFSSHSKLKSDTTVPSTSTSTKSWAIQPTKKVAPSAKKDYTSVFEQLVELYAMRQSNFDRMTDVEDSCKIVVPKFELAEWVYRNGTEQEREAVRGTQATVENLMRETERALREEMVGYYEMLDKTMKRKIDELVEGLPAELRAETNQQAYDTAMEKLGQEEC